MKITTLYDDQSHSLPWVSSPAPEELSVTRLSDLFSKALGRPPTKPGTRRAVAKIMLRWPDLRRVATVPESVLAKEGGLTPTQARKFLATVNLAFALAGMSQRCAKTITTPVLPKRWSIFLKMRSP